ncbi:oxygen-independent coproporphyrinogen-3 oxidase [Lewinella marina]|uniref:Heme chaperone HemW n=1 Tax=Neolewinella marina TaxID=438751 RepID=A0A2G0CC54_9BACT|nr:radical SAM family heme chaperone HemW [Neolewinella marina]NJB86713.1 oxygen-independent coproporphyrinogen-3 oxidase [Neolewinella marina]PHK97520.1 coproporphyrinogen III oxidase [Neolewinella marina]
MLYLHIPFCKQACSYCNFHFSTNLKGRGGVLSAMERELTVRRGELPAIPAPTLYFGGGTPSLLTGAELRGLFAVLEREGYYDPAAETEITLEANPDDLDPETIAVLADSPVNRLSIGIQSFDAEDLRFMNRAHSAREALTAVEKVRAAGFTNLSIDLIYGGQTTSDATWQENLKIATDLGVQHIASYALTVEPRTALGHRVAAGAVPDTDDEKFARQFNLLIDHLTGHGFDHYEISNFARPGYRSRHNSGYWTGQPYLGVGPGAHSFDGAFRRRWNVSNNARYARVWADIADHSAFAAAGPLLFEEEHLTPTDRYNEYVMTGLRRREGIDLNDLAQRFGPALADYFAGEMRTALREATVERSAGGTVYRLTRAGLAVADGVAAAAFAHSSS